MIGGTGWVEMCDNLKGEKCYSEYWVLLIGKTKESWISHPLTEGFWVSFMAVSARIKGRNQSCWRVLKDVIPGFPFRFNAVRTQSPERMTSDSVSVCIFVGWHINFFELLCASFNHDENHSPLKLKWLQSHVLYRGSQPWLLRIPYYSFLWKWLPITNLAVNLAKQTGSSWSHLLTITEALIWQESLSIRQINSLKRHKGAMELTCRAFPLSRQALISERHHRQCQWLSEALD